MLCDTHTQERQLVFNTRRDCPGKTKLVVSNVIKTISESVGKYLQNQ